MASMSLIFFIVLSIIGSTIQTDEITSDPPFVQSLNYLYKNIEDPTVNATGISNFNVLLEYIQQKMDNFDPNSRTWLMRYFSNGQFHVPNGPIIIFIGGEGEISEGWMRTGILFDMAREHGGYLFNTEHRFYGQSWPAGDLSLNSLSYLSSYQALADLANFVRTQKSKPQFANSKVIVASGSYPGALAVWFQHLYPDLVTGSWASSAPLLAKVDFPEYKEVVGQAIRSIGGEACYNSFYYGIRKLEELVNTRQISELKRIMKICDNFNPDNWLDIGAVFSSISNVAAGLVQNYNTGDIESACQQILRDSNDGVSGIANWYNSKLNPSSCYDYTFQATVAHMKNTQISNSMWRQWTYQLCNEFGYSQTSKSAYQPFGTKFPVEFYENICSEVFGINKDQFWGNIVKTNNYYGGLTPNVKNVYYSHGGIDPWHPAGIQKNIDGYSSVVPGYAHCKDFGSISDSDTPQMKISKERLLMYVRKWLA